MIEEATPKVIPVIKKEVLKLFNLYGQIPTLQTKNILNIVLKTSIEGLVKK